MEAIWACTMERWNPVIGDPTVLGWVTVGVYALACYLSLRVWRAAPFPAESRFRERAFWICLALILMFLTVNKQLDLQTLATQFGRCSAKLQGWIQYKQQVQKGLIMVFLLIAVFLLMTLVLVLRGTLRRNGIAALGVSFLIGFVLVRGLSFNQIDRLIGRELLSLRLNGWLELTGLVLIIISALWLLRKSKADAA